MKILVFVPVWQRKEIFLKCLAGLKRLNEYRKDINLIPFCIISEAWAEDYCLENNIKYSYAENKPLGRKMNFGFEDAMKLEWDYLMIIGSDDLIANEYLDIIYPFLNKKTHFFGISEIYFIDEKKRRAKFLNYELELTAGKCLERKFIEDYGRRVEVEWLDAFGGGLGDFSKGEKSIFPVSKAKILQREGVAKITGRERWMLWDDHLNNCLDNSMNRKLILWGCENQCINLKGKPLIIDLKSDVNIWGFDKINGKDCDYNFAISKIPELK